MHKYLTPLRRALTVLVLYTRTKCNPQVRLKVENIYQGYLPYCLYLSIPLPRDLIHQRPLHLVLNQMPGLVCSPNFFRDDIQDLHLWDGRNKPTSRRSNLKLEHIDNQPVLCSQVPRFLRIWRHRIKIAVTFHNGSSYRRGVSRNLQHVTVPLPLLGPAIARTFDLFSDVKHIPFGIWTNYARKELTSQGDATMEQQPYPMRYDRLSTRPASNLAHVPEWLLT